MVFGLDLGYTLLIFRHILAVGLHDMQDSTFR